MSNITLAEAVKLKSILRKRIAELNDEMDRVAFTIIVDKDKPEEPTRTLEQVEQELADVRKDVRTLDRLMYEANSYHTINFEGEALKLVEAIEYATQLRAQADKYKTLAAYDKRSIEYYSEDAPVYRIALYDPETYRLKAIECERHAHKISNAVNAKNYQIELEFDGDLYF
ncbi:hypothetical protein [Kurthia massiliensis]|uniref:hypothetical protein n=1 Tax=Kurthia massiliensis TaxID=1033739 RepID=UPI000289C419|nr:hypothetical protein [Kurthia massiliensis]